MKNSFEKLIELIEEKIKLLVNVNELNLMQQELITKGDFPKLILSLEERQKAIDELMRTDESIKVAYDEVEDYINNESSTHACEICKFNNLKIKTNMLLKQIIGTNQINKTVLIEKMDELKKSIKTINNNKKGLNAYSIIGSNINSIYFDKTK